ncbi:MAG: response regulator [Odoribacteraceae bacterium]|nr:response regulator [Odoribacteraceae bacterium]
MNAKTYVLLYCLLTATLVHGEDLSFRHYTTRDGLSNNNALCMIQDSSGFLWCGTPDGLNRFDSKSFKTFRYIPGDSTSLGNNNVHALHEASTGEIWVGTENGVYRLDPFAERFTPFPLQHGHPEGECDISCKWRKNIVYSIKEDHERGLWITTYGNGLYRHDLVTGKTRHYTRDDDPRSIPSDLGTKILVTHDGTVWVATNGLGMYRYIPADDRFARATLRDEATGKEARSIYALCEDSYGNIWACDNGLFRYDPGRGSTTSHLSGLLRNVHFIMEARDGSLYIGSDVGLTIYNVSDGSHATRSCRDESPAGLNDDFVYSILEDREGGIWVGTYCGGLNYLSPGGPLFEFYTRGAGARGLGGRIVNELREGADGSIWIGTDDRGLFRYDPRRGTFSAVTLDKDNPDVKVQALHADRDELWVGTYGAGIYRLSLATGRVLHYPGDTRGLDAKSVYSFYKNGDGRLWIGTQTGVRAYDPRQGRFSIVADFGFNSYVEQMEEDDFRTLWIASQGKGLVSINLETDSITFHSNEHTGLPEMVPTFCIARDKLFVGTSGHGLYLYDARRGASTRCTGPVLDAHGNIFSIIPGVNELWLVTSDGLLRYNTRDSAARLYDEEDGLLCHPFSTNTWTRASSGHLYIGGSNGFNRFLPRDIRDNDVLPRVAFTAFRLSNEETARPLDKSMKVTLPHDQSGFAIEFVATSFRAPSKNKYRYILQGFDKTWSYTDHRDNKATYTNLSPGDYLFRVAACNNDGKWNPREATLRVIVLPPWWATGVMFFVYVTLFICTLVAVYLLLLKRLKRSHQSKIEMMHYENERDLHEARFSLFTNITHEIRTPLSLILAPVEAILKRQDLPDEIQDDLDVIKKNSERLLDLSNQILDFTKVEQDLYAIKNTSFDIIELVETTTRRFAPTILQHGVRLETSFPEHPPLLLFSDREALTKMISNLLTNALKFTRDRLRVSVEEEPTGESILVTVEDNGAGISEKERENIFTLFYQGRKAQHQLATGFGIGLSIVQLLAKRMNITVRVESERNAYTRFTLVIPTAARPPGLPEKNSDACENTRQDAHAAKKQGTVLIVEDNEEYIVYLVRVFGRKYHVCTAPDGQKALKILKENTVDVIITDIMMPVMDGLQLCEHVKNDIRLSHIPVVLLTAKSDAASKLDALEKGADVYIEKPVPANYLDAQVSSLLENRNKLRRSFAGQPFTPIRAVAGNKSDERWFAKLNDCIQDNLSNPDFSVDQLARLTGTSRTLLYAKVKAVTGLTPNDFIRLARLKKAAEYLQTGEHKVNEISFMVGFNAPSYFAKCFQAQFGILPKEFMEQQYSRKR